MTYTGGDAERLACVPDYVLSFFACYRCNHPVSPGQCCVSLPDSAGVSSSSMAPNVDSSHSVLSLLCIVLTLTRSPLLVYFQYISPSCHLSECWGGGREGGAAGFPHSTVKCSGFCEASWQFVFLGNFSFSYGFFTA